jgi:hypothetical protein
MSDLAGIGHAPDEQTGAARDVLDCVKEWPIDFHVNRFLRFFQSRRQFHHNYGGGRRRFGSFFVHRDKCFVEDIRDRQITIRSSRGHSVEVGAALRIVSPNSNRN